MTARDLCTALAAWATQGPRVAALLLGGGADAALLSNAGHSARDVATPALRTLLDGFAGAKAVAPARRA